jgi:hypothetical protein
VIAAKLLGIVPHWLITSLFINIFIKWTKVIFSVRVRGIKKWGLTKKVVIASLSLFGFLMD